MPGPSLTQMATAYHSPLHLLALAHRGAAIGGHLQKPVEGMALVVAEFAQDRRQFHGAFERRDDLVHVEVALRRRQAGLVLLQEVARMAEARIGFLVIAPLDLPAFGGLGIAGVAHIGRVALVAQQRPADLLAGAGELGVRAEEGQRMVDRHHRQVLARHFRDQPAPDAGADHHMIGFDGAAVGHHALDAAVFDHERPGRGVGEGLELAGGFRLVDQLAGDRLRTRDDETGIGIPQAALHQVLFDQREFFLDLGGLDQPRARAEGLCRGHLALDLLHALVVADARDLKAADARVMAHLVVEIDGVVGLSSRTGSHGWSRSRSRRRAPSSRCRSGCRTCRCRRYRPSRARSGDGRPMRPRCRPGR